MKFTKIRLVGRTNIDLPFFGLRTSNPYILKAADGLGPPEINLFKNGSRYNGREPQDREVTLRVGLNPNYALGMSAESLRANLYGLLTPGPSDSMQVMLMNGPGVVAKVTGYIKNIEIVPFNKDPEVQIVISCDGPYLVANAPEVVPNPESNSAFTIDNKGQVTVGFYLQVMFTSALSSWTIYSEGPSSGPRLKLTYPFASGDILIIDTMSGQRKLKRTRGGSTINLFGQLSSDSLWFELHPGVNTFWTSSPNFEWNLIRYTPLYWGI